MLSSKTIFQMGVLVFAAAASPQIAYGQTTSIFQPPPPNVNIAVNSGFRQHDWDVITANGFVPDGVILAGDDYALRPTLNYIHGISEKFVSPDKLLSLRRKRLENLVTRNRKELDVDGDGNPIARDRVLLVDPTAAHLATAQGMGFKVQEDRSEAALGIRLVSLSTPRGQGAVAAVAALNAAAPGIGAEVDPIYEPAGAEAGVSGTLASGQAAAPAAVARNINVVMIDGGIGDHPSLKDAGIEKAAFAGKGVPTAHGTAVASLLVGNQGPFRGAALGAKLYAADMYGGNPAKGSASAMFRSLGWAASKKPAVVAISLAGPRSLAVERAIAALQKGGAKVVAAVGNDGSKAPSSYPASYSGVIAVTGTDRTGATLMESGRAEHIDFAAPGADLVAATPGRAYVSVRGTSFAVPLVVGRVLNTGSIVRLAREAAPGRGDVGLGVLCSKCGLTPDQVGKSK